MKYLHVISGIKFPHILFYFLYLDLSIKTYPICWVFALYPKRWGYCTHAFDHIILSRRVMTYDVF